MRLNIINFLDTQWEYDFKRPHLEALGKYTNLLCVEPPVTLDILLRRPRLFLDWLKRRKALRQIGETLYIYKPVALVPYSVSLRIPWLKKVNRYLMKASLQHGLLRLGMTDLVTMISHPAQDYVIGMLEEAVLCYDVYDAYCESPLATSGMKRL